VREEEEEEDVCEEEEYIEHRMREPPFRENNIKREMINKQEREEYRN
jgi:hypothetical protein